MKKIIFLFFVLIATISQAQVTVVGYISTQGVANYPTHIDSMGKGGYMVTRDTNQRNTIPCLRRKYGMAVYVQNLQKLYILKDSSCANNWIEFSGGGGGNQNLKSVLSVGHDLEFGQNYQGTGAGDGNTGVDVNAFGTNAGKSNTGNNINAFGKNAGVSNTGNNVNVFGDSSLENNSASNVNAFGYNAGLNNTYSNVNLFGENANATENNQLVLRNTIGYDARISYGCVNDNSKDYRLPNKSGYFMTASVPTIIDASAYSSYSIDYPDNYQVINVDADKDPMLLYFPDPGGECITWGQRLIITNIPTDGEVNGKIDLDQTYPIYYRGTSIPITQIGIGQTAEFYSDGSIWRTISSLPEPVVNINFDDLGGPYYILSNGTYNVTVATSPALPIIFPPACYMEGAHITIINRDATYSQALEVASQIDCPNNDIIKADGTIITQVSVESTSTYIAVNGEWIQIFERH